MIDDPTPDDGDDYAEPEIPAGKPAEELREDVADGDASTPEQED